ncbi:MAG: chromosome segregation protein SMC [Campylobacteraceae bacterium]|nr:chromosome segregation protein SMC [Campylobacteraceae bacterium]
MIERLYIKDHFSFKECELSFCKGLIAFTGPSGAGKSVLMQALLSLFGYGDANASLIEASVIKDLNMEKFGIQNDEVNVFRLIKSKTARYFVNSQNISKKNINEISKNFINYLSVKDDGEFENERLLELLDAIVAKKIKNYTKLLNDYSQKYMIYKELDEKLTNIVEKEKKVEELKDFARYEISKIQDINPKKGEDEELMLQKKAISKKDKIESALQNAMIIFESESSVNEDINLIEKDTSFFNDCMNELNAIFETQKEKLGDLEDVVIEDLLERIEKIAGLKKRYGSIEEAIIQKEIKAKELAEYENISFEKQELEKKHEISKNEIKTLSVEISKNRKKYLKLMNKDINLYLNELYMSDVILCLKEKELDELGIDRVDVNLGSVELKKISSGEYNRLRLAFLACRHEYLQGDGGVLILDEIDSNLSGKESMSVANVLLKLSQKYQIFAISHQPQLSSRANMHFFVEKNGNSSSVKLLDENERVVELARMVSGEEVHKKAIEFAKSLME